MAVVALMFFFPDDIQGNVLRQHDIMQGIANGQEGKAFHEATGETTRWTDSLFGGMPNFQIAPSYPANKALDWLAGLYRLWLPSPAGLLFSMMAGFFIMCLCMKLKWHEALFAALGWGFSTYFIIIIGAGHIWKFLTLSYIPPTIGGLALCYRGRYLAGSALAALFGALQLESNHPQMSYYFGLVMLCLMLAWLYTAIREHKVKRWLTATACCVGAGALALAANSASLYNSYEYSKETVRGRATELTAKTGGAEASGMDRDAITAWSYGLDETFSLLIPNVKGGATIKPVAGDNKMLSAADTDKAADLYISPEEMQLVGQFPQYFGDQPMTNGPVYVGAFLLMLAILGMFTVKGHWETPVKWALFAASVISVLLAWGHNFPALTNAMIDSFPGYNKFRAVASILVIVEFCIPLLAALCVKYIIATPDYFKANKWTVAGVMGAGAAVCLIGWISPSVFGQPYSAQEIEALSAQGVLSDPMYAGVFQAISQSRLSLVSSDSLRSLMFIVAGSMVLLLYARGLFRNNAVAFSLCLSAIVLLDLFSVNKRYVSTESFVEPVTNEEALSMTPADEAILKDKSHYRVMDVDGFSSARSSYFHKTIGGYHAAKLTRYNDLINEQISKGNPEVLNMLNAKYFLNQGQYEVNPGALGNAWWVDRIDYVATPDQEMAALDSLRPGIAAVADRRFEQTLGKASPRSAGDTVTMTSYAPNRLVYKARSAKGGVAVFSEVFFPWGWTATVDGKETPIGRVDYVLRALRLPAGEHEVVFTFDPQSLRTTNTISVVAVVLIYILGAVALFAVGRRMYRKEKR